MDGKSLIRRMLLCLWRDRKPHQRTVQSVCRSGQHGDDAGQSDAVVSVDHGLCTGEWIAVIGIEVEGNGVGGGAGIDDLYPIAEDWRADPGHGAQGLGLDGFQLPLARSVCTGLGKPALLNRSGTSASSHPGRPKKHRPRISASGVTASLAGNTTNTAGPVVTARKHIPDASAQIQNTQLSIPTAVEVCWSYL
jgi:hypothetical protein